jgi:molybdenum cofactor synthesis domain-containing protein
MSAACGWADVAEPLHVPDEPERIRTTLAEAVQRADAILLTGGVSMGQYDHVPDAVRSVGGEVVFHKLPIRPGKPVLAAAGPGGQVIFGLPGNPVSVMVTARRIAAGALRRLAGFTEACPPVPAVRLTDADDETLALRWFRPVRLTGPGQAELVSTRGSGDMVSAARGDGFVEVPPGESGQGPWPFYAWEL